MKNLASTLTDDAYVSFPYDLGVWMDRQPLMGLALQTAAEAASRHFGAGDFIRDGKRYRPQVLLALLSYSYATGRFASSSIEQAIREDEKTRYLAVNSHLEASLLRNFRRRYRPALKECLLNLIRSVWETRPDPRSTPLCAKVAPTAVPRLVPQYGRFLRDLVCEVERRIDRAVQFDTMELDE